MKLLKYFFFFFFISSSVYAKNVKITDYDIPVSSARQAFLTGFYNWSETSPLDSLTPKNITSDYRIDGTFTQFYTSPAWAWNLGLSGAIFGKREDTTRYSYAFNTDVSKYFSDSKGFFVNGAFTSTYTRQKEFGVENRPVINLFGGLGYGRQVNATPLAKALRIDDELRKSRVTSKYLPKTTMLNIARIIDRESEYKAKYKQIYEAKIIEDIQKEIAASGVADPTMSSSMGYYRIQSVLFSRFDGTVNYNFTNPRYYGGDVRLGVSYQVLTRNEKIGTPNPAAEVRARYGYPIGLNHQVLFALNGRTFFDSTFGKTWEAEGAADYWYNMSNRVQFNAGYRLTLQRAAQQVLVNGVFETVAEDYSTANHRLFAGFIFYLENYITLSLQGAYDYLHGTEERFSTNVIASFIIF